MKLQKPLILSLTLSALLNGSTLFGAAAADQTQSLTVKCVDGELTLSDKTVIDSFCYLKAAVAMASDKTTKKYTCDLTYFGCTVDMLVLLEKCARALKSQDPWKKTFLTKQDGLGDQPILDKILQLFFIDSNLDHRINFINLVNVLCYTNEKFTAALTTTMKTTIQNYLKDEESLARFLAGNESFVEEIASLDNKLELDGWIPQLANTYLYDGGRALKVIEIAEAPPTSFAVEKPLFEIATTSANSLQIVDTETKIKTALIKAEGSDAFFDPVMSNSGNRIAIRRSHGTRYGIMYYYINVWDISIGDFFSLKITKLPLNISERELQNYTFSNDGNYIGGIETREYLNSFDTPTRIAHLLKIIDPASGSVLYSMDLPFATTPTTQITINHSHAEDLLYITVDGRNFIMPALQNFSDRYFLYALNKPGRKSNPVRLAECHKERFERLAHFFPDLEKNGYI